MRILFSVYANLCSFVQFCAVLFGQCLDNVRTNVSAGSGWRGRVVILFCFTFNFECYVDF